MNNKLTGSYYTPNRLVKHMVEYISQNSEIKYILEPSTGDGRFLEELINLDEHIIDAVEMIEEKAKNIEKIFTEKNINSINTDFLEYCKDGNPKYDLVIGNPPYINKKHLNERQKELSNKLCEESGLSSSVFKNIWVSFILGAMKLLKENGTIFFVLPFEFLQVDYARKLRNYLETKFRCIEIFVFNERVFPDIEQDVCLVYLSNENDNVTSYIKYNIIDQLDLNNPIASNKIMRNKPLDKWSNSIISDEEIEMINRLKQRCTKVRDIGSMSPGVVTGANKHFILKNSFVKNKKLQRYVKQIISKSAYVGDKLIFTDEDFNELRLEDKAVYLLKLNGFKYSRLPKSLKEYLKELEDEEVNERYKCSIRKPWYNMPEAQIGDLVFFKRYDEIPRLIVNRFNSYTTDIGYNIKVREIYDINSIAFCFYNSLTLLFCEFHGRYYGGGVSELTPNEFREVPIPYMNISNENINVLDQMLRNNVAYDDIVSYVNRIVLPNVASDEEIVKLEEMRKRYINRRK